jgi:hypothetical protein
MTAHFGRYNIGWNRRDNGIKGLHPDNKQALEQRVVRAAEAALAKKEYVSAIDVLTGMGLLAPRQVDDWRKGRVDFLERVIQGNLAKISFSMATFRRWALAQGLRPSETRYVRTTRAGPVDLQFSKSGAAEIEQSYRTHYVSPALSERKQKKLQDRESKAPQPVVFLILRDSECTECAVEIPRDSFLYMEAGQPLCLACARLDHLEYLPAGDAALTRRAGKYSASTAVVVRFSRSRERYERQGILVESAALERAEKECTLDAEARALARAHAAASRREQDRELIARMTTQIGILFPGCPPKEASAIASHTAARGSGRVGRTSAGKNLDERALIAAVTAAVRHKRTAYDELLTSGLDRA